jgi:hypothetical protein
MVLRFTQPLTGMSTKDLAAGRAWLMRKADNLTAICEPTVYKMWEPQHLLTIWASTACYRDSFTYFYIVRVHTNYIYVACSINSHGYKGKAVDL